MQEFPSTPSLISPNNSNECILIFVRLSATPQADRRGETSL